MYIIQNKIILTLVAALLGIPLSFVGWINWKYATANNTQIFEYGGSKIWSHRGYSSYEKENSINSIKAAVDKGYAGVEIDIFYLPHKNKFLVSHDYPPKAEDTSSLYLENVFHQFQGHTKFWLDFKNCGELDSKGLKQSLEKLNQLNAVYKIKSNILIESQSPDNLRPFAQHGYFTSYWIWLPKSKNPIYRFLKMLQIKWNYTKGPFYALSMPFDLYAIYKGEFGSKNIHVFTVNSKKLAESLMERKQVKIILSDSLNPSL